MKTIFIYTLCLFSYWTTYANNALTTAAPQDSVGYEIVNGKLVILHKVEKGETLYALARRYQTSVAAIQQANGAAAQALAVGTVIKVPTERKPITPTKKVESNSNTTAAQKHTVTQGQTLYAVSRLYNVSVDDIRKWNNLTSDNLSAGQELIVGQKANTTAEKPTETTSKSPQLIEKDGKKIHTVGNGESLFSIAKQYNTTAENLRRWNNLKQDALSVGQQIVVAQTEQNVIAPKPANTDTPTKENTTQNTTPTTINTSAGYEKITENGIAEVVISEGGTEPRGHVCLHKTAPVGTILQVKNELNGLIVFVRVVGKLPETIANEKLIIRISKKAHERLGAVDKRFPVEVSYPKP